MKSALLVDVKPEQLNKSLRIADIKRVVLSSDTLTGHQCSLCDVLTCKNTAGVIEVQETFTPLLLSLSNCRCFVAIIYFC